MSQHAAAKLLIAILLGIGTCCATAADKSDGDPHAKSTERVELLRRLIRRELKRRGAAVTDLSLMRRVLVTFASVDECPRSPRAAPVLEQEYRKAAEATTLKLTQQRYPDADLEQLKAEAEEAYPICKEGDIVTIEYQASPVLKRKYKGVYRGRMGDAIVVGPKRILLRDMAVAVASQHPPKDDEDDGGPEITDYPEILRFFEDKSLTLRKALVNEKLAFYRVKQKEFARSVRAAAFREEKKRAVARNERNGYVYMTGKWNTLRETMEELVRQERELLHQATRTVLPPPKGIGTVVKPPADKGDTPAPTQATGEPSAETTTPTRQGDTPEPPQATGEPGAETTTPVQNDDTPAPPQATGEPDAETATPTEQGDAPEPPQATGEPEATTPTPAAEAGDAVTPPAPPAQP